MARIRTVKPEFGSNEGLSELSCQAHLLGMALLCYADDEGYFNANPGLVKAGTCPLREDFQNIYGLLTELSGIGYLRFGTFAGKRYGHIVKFREHQRISHPTPSKISNLPIHWDNSREIPEPSREIPEDSASAQDVLRPEQGTGNREQEGEARERATAPHSRSILLSRSAGADGEFIAATGLMQDLKLAATAGDIRVMAQVIALEAPERGGVEAATDWLRERAIEARTRGEAVTVFWFKDRKFEKGKRTSREWDAFVAEGGTRDDEK
jgi:hypothetical protein